MASRALVLGGGGPVGVAWETGLVAGLAEQGADLSGAVIIGTSAGAVVGAQLALGRSPQEMLARQLALGESGSVANRAFDVSGLIAIYAKFYSTGMPIDAFRREVGAYALKASTVDEEERMAGFGQMVGVDTWPERALRCTAIDTADGSFVVWDRDSGVRLIDALASSCAVPGVFPPVTINGRRYMDGGMGSMSNAELARGHERVLVVALAGMGRNVVRERLERELDVLRASGSEVELIVPDEASVAAFGPSVMDGRRRKPSAEAGLRQGRAEAARLAFLRAS